MKQSQLAIKGGPKASPVYREKLFHWPIVTDEDVEAVKKVMLDGASPSMTDITIQFEKEWAEYNGVKHALGSCNGTAALAAGLWALGIGAGDEVIAPAITYWASCACAIQLGASVNFADIDPVTLCIDPDDVERRIGPRTKAIIVVNFCGYPADWDRLLAIAKKYDLKILEDNSHGHGAMYKGRMCGSFGDVAGASMMSGKAFAIGEAGMITTNDTDLYKRCIAYGHYERTFGSKYNKNTIAMDLPDLEPYIGMPMGGCKHRMNQMCAAMGRVQLKYWKERIAEIDKAMTYFCDRLDQMPGLKSHRPPAGSGITKGGWYMPRCFYDPEAFGGLTLKNFMQAIAAEQFVCQPGNNEPLHRHPYFHTIDFFRQGKPTVEAFGQRKLTNLDEEYPVSCTLGEKCFVIPWFKHFDQEGIDEQLAALEKVIAHADELLNDQKKNEQEKK